MNEEVREYCLSGHKPPAFSMLSELARATVRLYPFNVLPQTPHNVTAELHVDSLTLGDHFTAQNPIRFLQACKIWAFPLETAENCSVVARNAALINDPPHATLLS